MARAILTVVATLGALWVCILLLCLVNHLHIDSATGLLQRRWGKGPFARQQQLAYDGPYDTPPVTWYYPATTNNENTLGYTWDKADMQNTAVTYEPGIMNPLGSGIEYQNQEEMHPGLAAVKQRARTQRCAGSDANGANSVSSHGSLKHAAVCLSTFDGWLGSFCCCSRALCTTSWTNAALRVHL